MNKKNTQYVWIAVIIIVLLAIWALSKKSQNPITQTPTSTQTPTASPSATPKVSKTPSVIETNKTYGQLVQEYAGRRIQFDTNCQTIPSNSTFKNNTAVMFDNRSASQRTIKIGDSTYQFPAYGYRFVTLKATTFPKIIYLSCGSSVNVGQILLQK